jgi:DNA-binding MarR family transcriptional regulator
MVRMGCASAPDGPSFDAQVDALLDATRVLLALSVRTLGSIRPALTPVQLRALVVLSGPDSVTMGELADALGVHPSNATRVCDRLELLELVHRQENRADRRTLSARLTSSGENMLRTIMEARRGALAEILAAIPPERRAGLATDLRALVTAARGTLPDSDLAPLGWVPTWRG